MSGASQTVTPVAMDRPQLTALEKAVAFVSWALAGVILWTVGWFALAPTDPLGAVTLAFSRQGALLSFVQVLFIAAVTAGLATVIAGRKLADVGTFAVMLGLSVLSFRGATAESVLLRNADLADGFARQIAWTFAGEAAAWVLVMIVALGVSVVVARWCFGAPSGQSESATDVERIALRAMSGYDVPGVSARWFSVRSDAQTGLSGGIRHCLFAWVLGFAAMEMLANWLDGRSIQHGQVCFGVVATVFIATDFAYRFSPVRSPFWSILAVMLVAISGYVWSALAPAAGGFPPGVPASHFLRVLPIQYIAIGTASAIGTFWYIHLPDAGGRDPDRSRSD